MKIAIVGTGYIGLITDTYFAEMGTEIFCADVDKVKTGNLKKGIVPICEPGLDEMVTHNSQAGRLHFMIDLKECLNEVEVLSCVVDIPPDEDGSTDLKYVPEIARTIGRYVNRYILAVTKNTVPVSITRRIKRAIKEEQALRDVSTEFDIAFDLEFLKEGAAIKDSMGPDRVVVEVESDYTQKLMAGLYRPFLLNSFRIISMDMPSTEMTKYAADAILATRISFMNNIANLCEVVGAGVSMVRKGIDTDVHISSRFLYAGCGYGRSCFPKDVKALAKTAANSGYRMRILETVEAVSGEQESVLFRKLMEHFRGDIQGKRIALWGLTFKSETDDVREAPSLVLIEKLKGAGCVISAYDPVAIPKTQRRLPVEVVSYGKDTYETVMSADTLLLVTEWKGFRMPLWSAIKKLISTPLILDGHDIYDKTELGETGSTYHCVGR